MEEYISKEMSDLQYDSADGTWGVWSDFCKRLDFKLLHTYYQEPVPVLLAFYRRYHHDILAPSGIQVYSRTIDGAI